MEGQSLFWRGRLLGKAEPLTSEEAEGHILQGINLLDELKTKPLCAQGHLCLGEFYKDAGKNGEALESLGKARAMFQEMGMDYLVAPGAGPSSRTPKLTKPAKAAAISSYLF
jgi:hypothetical protein